MSFNGNVLDNAWFSLLPMLWAQLYYYVLVYPKVMTSVYVAKVFLYCCFQHVLNSTAGTSPSCHLFHNYLLLYLIMCLLIIVVQRPESVKIDARDINGTRFSVNLSDLPARIFQHEFDHLQVCFSTWITKATSILVCA